MLTWSMQAGLLAQAKSPYVARISCLTVSSTQHLLLCGDNGGSIMAFGLPQDLKPGSGVLLYNLRSPGVGISDWMIRLCGLLRTGTHC